MQKLKTGLHLIKIRLFNTELLSRAFSISPSLLTYHTRRRDFPESVNYWVMMSFCWYISYMFETLNRFGQDHSTQYRVMSLEFFTELYILGRREFDLRKLNLSKIGMFSANGRPYKVSSDFSWKKKACPAFGSYNFQFNRLFYQKTYPSLSFEWIYLQL